MTRVSLLLILLVLGPLSAIAQGPDATAELVARAKALELKTPYVPPPGDSLSHHASGFAKVMCSAVFVTGLDPDFAAENVGYFVAPPAARPKLGKPVVDRAAKEVQIALPTGGARVARYVGDQGCVTLPEGETKLHYTPKTVPRQLPDARTTPWPM